MSINYKALLSSKTVWSGVVVAILGGLQMIHHGVTISADDQNALVQSLEDIGTAVGGIAAIVSRIVAAGPLTNPPA